MNDKTNSGEMPAEVAAIADAGYAAWASDDVDASLKARFSDSRIPVDGVRHVRQWGIQVDDERALPGHERTQIPDEELWEIRLIAEDGQCYEVNASLLKAAGD